MAHLDVSEVLTDPDFLNRLRGQRMAETVDENGVTQLTPQPLRFWGAVFSDGKRIERQADAETAHGEITVFTRFKLRSAKAGYTADVIFWDGAQYTVDDLRDMSNWGSGFVKATCTLNTPSG